MRINEGTVDRVVRVLVAILLSVWATRLAGGWAVVVWVLAAIAFLTGVSGRCGLYSLLHIKTTR